MEIRLLSYFQPEFSSSIFQLAFPLLIIFSGADCSLVQFSLGLKKRSHPEDRLPEAFFAKGAFSGPKDLNVKIAHNVAVGILRLSSSDRLRMTALSSRFARGEL